MQYYFKKIRNHNIIIFLIFFLISIVVNYKLFLDFNFFPLNDEDVYSLYDYRLNNNLSGWRFNTGVGQSFLAGDPSFHSWSIINLFFQLPIENKIYLHYFIYFFLISYCCFSIYFLIDYINKDLDKLYKILISSLYCLASFKSEFYYLTQWIMIASGISFSSIILFKYFKSKKDYYILIYSLNIFIIFNLSGAVAVQQSLFYSIVFSVIYFFYFKENLSFIKSYFKIIFLSLIILLISSLWIFYPTLYYSFSGEYDRSSHYFLFTTELNFKQFFSEIFNILFGNLFNKKDILFPDKNLTPNYSWFSNLPLVINLFFLSLLFKIKKNFWESLCLYSLVFYTLHALLSHLFPLYSVFNTIFISVYPWSKVYVEIFVLQILMISLILNNKIIFFNQIITTYKKIIKIFLFLMLIIIIDSYAEGNLINFVLYTLKDFDHNFLNINNFLLSEILVEYFDRFNLVKDKNLFAYFFGSIGLIYLYNSKFIHNKYFTFYFVVLLLLTTFFHSNHFSPLNKNKNVWEVNKLKDKIKITDRIIYVTEINKYNLGLKNIDLLKFKDWKLRHKIDNNQYYGYRSPPTNSFSRVTSFNSKKIQNLLYEKKGAYSQYRNLQYPNISNLDPILLNNLSINLIISKDNLKKNFPIYLEDFFTKHDKDAYLFESKDPLPYFYLTKRLIKENSFNFLNQKINKNYAYIENDQLNLTNKNYSTKGNIELTKMDDGELNFSYNSSDRNFLIISDLYDKNWKLLIDGKKNDIYRVNFFFKGFELPPGNYSIKLYYDNSKFLLSIFISVLTLLILLYYIFKKQTKLYAKNH